ncbi:hypothetical protein [Calothrix rhizosoleniae]|uniref:hypothetical protein n=1 Tax=Calothrix rhizosoleniae TaxID=888997 RepID=UPI001F2533B4|nr:hypothetical protein [Calothrix rhizosoleniae]
MLEKLLLAVTITFSLNLLLQIKEPNPDNNGVNYRQNTENAPTLLVLRKDK